MKTICFLFTYRANFTFFWKVNFFYCLFYKHLLAADDVEAGGKGVNILL